jgi:hypothetical protein
LNFFRKLKSAAGCLLRDVLLVCCRCIARKQHPSQLMVMLFVLLYSISIKSRRFVIAARFAKFYEALITHESYGFACELGCGYASDRALKRAQVFEQ